MRDRGLIDDAYLKGHSVYEMRTSLQARARGGGRALRQLDNIVNLQWFHGRPWYIRNQEANRLVGMPPAQRARYIHVNKAFPIVRTIKGTMFYKPEVESKPLTGDTQDKLRAYMKESLAKHVIEAGSIAKAYARIVDMCNIEGHGAMKVAYDPSAGRRQPLFGTQPCPKCQGSGIISGPTSIAPCDICGSEGLIATPQGYRGAGEVQEYLGSRPEGEVKYKAISGNNLLVDPEAEDLDSVEEICERIRMPVSKAFERYGRALGFSYEEFESQAGSGTSDEDNFYARVGQSYQLPLDEKYVKVYEYYQVPSDRFPEGVHGVTVGTIDVLGGKLPYAHDEQPHPYIFFPMYDVYGQLYPVATLDLAIPLIVALCDHMTTKHVRARMSSKLRFKVPRESRFEMNDANGNAYFSRTPGGDKPEEMRHSPAPSDLDDIIDFLDNFIDRLVGATDILSGNYPTDALGNTRAMAFLEESASKPFRPIILDHAARMKRCMQYGCDLAAIHFDDGRMLQIAGPNGSQQVVEFRSENVTAMTDVELKSVRNIGQSRATMLAEADEALQRGAISVEEYRDIGQFGDMGELYVARKMHENRAKTENDMLLAGMMPPPLKYQDHKIHLKVHAEKANELQDADPYHPLLPGLFMHMQETEFLLAQAQVEQEMLMQQAMMQYGAAEQANPANHTPEAQAAVAAQEPFSANPSGPPGSQPGYQNAADAAGAADKALPAGVK